MKQQAVIPIRRDDDIEPLEGIHFPGCPVCGNSIEEFDDMEILIHLGTVCLVHENCDEIEEVEDDEPEGEIIDNDTGRVY